MDVPFIRAAQGTGRSRAKEEPTSQAVEQDCQREDHGTANPGCRSSRRRASSTDVRAGSFARPKEAKGRLAFGHGNGIRECEAGDLAGCLRTGQVGWRSCWEMVGLGAQSVVWVRI